MCMVEGRSVNLATVFAQSMKRLWRGGQKARVYCGPYVTWLAESLDVFDRYPADRMREGPAPCYMRLEDLQIARLITYSDPPTWVAAGQGPQVPPPADTEASHTMRGAIHPRYQVPLRTRYDRPAPEYPVREPPPDPITLASLYDRMDLGFSQMQAGFSRMDDGFSRMDAGFARRDQRQDVQDGAMRYMMDRMNIPVPPFFQQGVDPTQYPMPGYYDPGAQGGFWQGGGSGSGYGGGSGMDPED